MTRKHFEAIAKIIRDAAAVPAFQYPHQREYFDGQVAAVEFITEDLADYFATVNPNFDRERFIRACQPD
jgi:hypothetical protein